MLVPAKKDVTDAELSAMPNGCRCGRAKSYRTGLWRLIDRHDCPEHSAPVLVKPIVSADLPGLPGVPAQIGPIRCPDCGQRCATVHHRPVPELLSDRPEDIGLMADGDDYTATLICPECGAVFELAATAYAVGLAAGVLAEMARQARVDEDGLAGKPCPECGSLLAYSHCDGCSIGSRT